MRARFQERVANELILKVQRRVEAQAQEFVGEKTLERYYIYDFLFDHGKILPVITQ